MTITDVAGVTRSNAYKVPPEELREGPHSRRWLDPDVTELALDILERGQLVPALVQWSKDGQGKDCLEIVEGHRRAAAIRYINENGLYTERNEVAVLKVRCELFTGQGSFAASVAANHKRKGLTPIDRAHSIATLEQGGMTRKDIAKLLEVSEPTLTQDLKLLTLSAKLQKDIHNGKLAASIGYELAGMEPAERDKALEPAPTTDPSTAAGGQTGGQTASQAKPTRTSVRKAKRDKAERGEAVSGSVSRSRKEVYNLFAEWAGCGDGSIEDPIMKLCAAIVKYMDGGCGDRAILNRMRELAEGGE